MEEKVDFLKDEPEKKEICESCSHDYLEDDDCKLCSINVQIENILDNWYKHPDFSKLAAYRGINLGELARYDLRHKIIKQLLFRKSNG